MTRTPSQKPLKKYLTALLLISATAAAGVILTDFFHGNSEADQMARNFLFGTGAGLAALVFLVAWAMHFRRKETDNNSEI